MKDQQNFTVSTLAKKAQVNTETIRFYEKNGLLPEPKRLNNGYRIYSQSDLQLLLFIRTCQNLGFSLHEISELSDLSVKKGQNCSHLHEITNQKLSLLEEKISQLHRMKVSLTSFANTCSGNTSMEDCHLVHSLWGKKG
jgi:MerR family copper efflux transcriptional regulator